MLRATWTTWTHGRRCALAGASAAVVALGGLLAACGGGGPGDGYVATGAAGGPPGVVGTAVAPTGEVRLVPLDGPEAAEGGDGSPAGTPPAADRSRTPGTAGQAAGGTARGPAPPTGTGPAPAPTTAPSGSARPPDGTAPPAPSPSAPQPGGSTPSPAKLTAGDPEREPTDRRWCEKVTVGLHNSGGTAVRSGTVTFATHVIGALGIDWATVESTQELPVPIAAGAREEKAWTVCVDAWRVPLGMRIETRDVTVRWE